MVNKEPIFFRDVYMNFFHKYQDQPDIEKEVKRLFRMDNEAIDVKWEVNITSALDSN